MPFSRISSKASRFCRACFRAHLSINLLFPGNEFKERGQLHLAALGVGHSANNLVMLLHNDVEHLLIMQHMLMMRTPSNLVWKHQTQCLVSRSLRENNLLPWPLKLKKVRILLQLLIREIVQTYGMKFMSKLSWI